MRIPLLIWAPAIVGLALAIQARDTVGSAGRTATFQSLRPAGTQIEFGGRPVDGVISSDGQTLFVKDNRGVVEINAQRGAVLQEIPLPGGTSMKGIALSKDGTELYVTNSESDIRILSVDHGRLSVAGSIAMPKPAIGGDAYPCGIALAENGHALVCLSRNNSLAEVDLKNRSILRQIPVDIAPFDIAIRGDTAVVSCWARQPVGGKPQALSAGTSVDVDGRGIGTGGSVCLVDLSQGRVSKRSDTGLQPSGVVASKDGFAYIANANSDTVTVLDLNVSEKQADIVVKPNPDLPFGSAPNAVAFSPDESLLYVPCGGNNAVAVLDRRFPVPRITGWIPAGWYPGGIVPSAKDLFVLNVKGIGSRHEVRPDGGRSVYSYQGTISKIPTPSQGQLSAYTKTVNDQLRSGEILANLKRTERPVTQAVPVPKRLGDPSVFEHVVYIIKENRTYDQLFGDLKQADGDPKLVMYGRKVTPNHHALAEQFVVLDNYYCNGVNSADGHAWAVEGNASSYLERSFGGFTRSYPFGDDPLTPSSSGFLWDNVLGHSLSFRNYGEFDNAEVTPAGGFGKVYRDYLAKTGKYKFKQDMRVDRIRRYSCRDYPGWNLAIPDQLRADRFLTELKDYESRGFFPNLTIIYLPQDHTSGLTPGGPSPRAQVADNDLALGRIVDALSHSKFWPKTCIFVNEDDPQNGFDHVDGHRSLCLVVSPYTKRGKVVSSFYNQTSVLLTMERMLGLPPLNQIDARSPIMDGCFQARADMRPYSVLPNQIPLDEVNKPASSLTGEAKRMALASLRQDLRRPDVVDDRTFNRILWFAAKGGRTSFPARFEGAHGQGLAKRGLKLDTVDQD